MISLYYQLNMYSKQIILALSLTALALASTVQIQTMDFETYMRNLNLQTDNYFGCLAWKHDLCDQYDIFKLDQNQKCVLQEQYDKAGCKHYLQIGVCIMCEEGWLIRTVVFKNMKESSLFCIPEASMISFEEEKGCEECKDGYRLKDGLCQKVDEKEEMMSDLGCIKMMDGKCEMCWPRYRRNMEGKCVRM